MWNVEIYTTLTVLYLEDSHLSGRYVGRDIGIVIYHTILTQCKVNIILLAYYCVPVPHHTTPIPNAVKATDQLNFCIEPQHLQVWICGHVVTLGRLQYFINKDTAGKVKVASSIRTWERVSGNGGGLLSMELQKANKGIVWEAICMGPLPLRMRTMARRKSGNGLLRCLLQRQSSQPAYDNGWSVLLVDGAVLLVISSAI